MSTRLKRNLGMLFATAVFLVAALAALPGESEAQDALPGEAQSTPTAKDIPTQEDAGNTNRDAGAAPDQQPDQQPATRAVEPGDTLWAIAQERLGPNAPPVFIDQEVGRLFELNREEIGNDTDLILPGQELLLTERPEPAADAAVPDSTPTPAEGAATAEQPTKAEATPESEDGSATTESSATANPEPSYPEISSAGWDAPDPLTLLIQSGLFLGALTIGLFSAWKLYRTRRLLTARREPRAGQYRSVYDQDDRYLSLYPQQEANDTAPDAPTGDVRTSDAPEPTAAGSRTSDRG